MECSKPKKIIIAIDGFSSCGKSTFAKTIAAKLGYIFIDTGAMYRAVTLYALEHGAIVSGIVDEEKVIALLDDISIDFRFNPERGASDIYVNGDRAEGRIRTIEVSNCVSRVSSIRQVREKLVAMQQAMGRQRGVVMDGRDIGTVVFPNAEMKIFMTADPEVRARRRYDELLAKGDSVSLEEIRANIVARDKADNRVEVQRLERLGMHTVTHDQMPELGGRSLFIRAHGEPPSTYRLAEELGIELIDATCPVVAKLQRRVVEAHEKMRQVGGQVVILGKRGHAEVIGLTGQVEAPTLVVETEEDLDQIDFTRPIYFLSQTTQSISLFQHLCDRMRSRATDPAQVFAHDTICRQVSNRESHLEEFAGRFDVIIFVCGRKSSNGRVLFEVCRRANPRSYNVEEASELRPEWFEGAESVGICGATSTPKWLMQEVADAVAGQKP